jgi:hypothetical protein
VTAADDKAATPSDSPSPNADAVGVDILSGAGNEQPEPAEPAADPEPKKKAAPSK